MYETLIANALQSGAKATGYNMQKAREYLKEYVTDYDTFFALARTCAWAYNENGTVQYAGQAYDYQQSKDGYTVTLRTDYPVQ